MDFIIEEPTSKSGEVVTCVARLAGKYEEYVRLDGRVDLVSGERTVTGLAVPHTINSVGPSNSHDATVWRFIGPTRVGEVNARRAVK